MEGSEIGGGVGSGLFVSILILLLSTYFGTSSIFVSNAEFNISINLLVNLDLSASLNFNT